MSKRSVALPFAPFLLVAPAFALSTLGCITTAGGKLADAPVAERDAASRPAIEQTVGAFSFHLDGGKMVTSNKMGRELNNEILSRWVELGLIEGHTYVKSSGFSAGAAYRLTLEGHQEGESSILLQILSGLTLYAIPHYVNTQMQLTYVLENSASGCRFSASVDESYNTVISLLVAPAMPFLESGRDVSFDRIARHLYAQLDDQAAFSSPPAAMRPCDRG